MLRYIVIFSNELEKRLEQENVIVKNLESEIERLKTELEGLRIDLDEKNSSSMEMRKVEEEIRVKGKDGLSGRLREDFDKMVDDYKMELERSYQKDRENLQSELEYQLQAEKQRVQEDAESERKKLMEEIAKEREDMERSMKKTEEGKTKVDERFSKESDLKYYDEYSSNNRCDTGSVGFKENGMRQNERLGKEQDCRETERERDSYRGERNPNGYNSENSGCYDTGKYSSPSCRQSVPDKFEIEYETPYEAECIQYNYKPDERPSEQALDYGERGDLKDYGRSETPEAKKDLFYVTPGNENSLRSEINELRRENEGFKAKIQAMEENIELHRTYKTEAKEELSRLQKAKDELQSKLKNKGKEQDDTIKVRNKVGELEKSFRDSEAKRKEFEEKIKELNGRLSEAEKKSKHEKERVHQLEDKLKGEQSQPKKAGKNEPIGMKDRSEACHTRPLYQELESCFGNAPNNESGSGSRHASQDNVYGYPSESKDTGYKSRYSGDTTASICGSDSYRSSAYDPVKDNYSDRFNCSTGYPRVTRPDLYSSCMASSPIHGSHSGLSTSSGRKPDKTDQKYKPGRCGTFEVTSRDPYFDTSSPRAQKAGRRENASLDPKDSEAAKKKVSNRPFYRYDSNLEFYCFK
jgi:hypothetical protein